MQRTSAEEQFLYLTTKGRSTGLPRQIEIWFIAWEGRYYLFSAGGMRSQWVRNIQHDSSVQLKVGTAEFAATGRILDKVRDRAAWEHVQALARTKYGWSDGLPVELTPIPHR